MKTASSTKNEMIRISISRSLVVVFLALAMLRAQSSAGAPLGSLGRRTNDPVIKAFKNVLMRQTNSLLWAADAMPTDKYNFKPNFKPSAQQSAFAQIIGQVVLSNNIYCSILSGAKPQEESALSDKSSKDQLVSALARSFEFCKESLSKVGDSKLGDTVGFTRDSYNLRAAAAFELVETWADTYRHAAVYLRLNGLDPPTESVRD